MIQLHLAIHNRLGDAKDGSKKAFPVTCPMCPADFQEIEAINDDLAAAILGADNMAPWYHQKLLDSVQKVCEYPQRASVQMGHFGMLTFLSRRKTLLWCPVKNCSARLSTQGLEDGVIEARPNSHQFKAGLLTNARCSLCLGFVSIVQYHVLHILQDSVAPGFDLRSIPGNSV